MDSEFAERVEKVVVYFNQTDSLGRKNHLDMILDSPLKPLIMQCLRDNPTDRPTTSRVFHVLEQNFQSKIIADSEYDPRISSQSVPRPMQSHSHSSSGGKVPHLLGSTWYLLWQCVSPSVQDWVGGCRQATLPSW